ncbi:MAG: bifunctional 3-deoxy-7-phosphoheptulonate synthase/chorismate mutase type II [Porphyromonas sp.]|nr:bifunctional 3-deoxy-7-phosphoheptulonate synthase/chorismate mutase type II [Porphyromonas sp.]
MQTDVSIKPLDLPLYGPGAFTLIAGPCSAESEMQVMETAAQLLAGGVKVFRAGLWKPRTRPDAFEGVGCRGLPWLERVKQELGMLIATEVAGEKHVEKSIEAGIDILWIGARTTSNPFLVSEIARALSRVTNPPIVLVKNPINPDADLWSGAFERLYRAGVTRLGAIHRGFSTYTDSIYRNPPQWQIPIELMRRFPDMTILGDPSHIAGKRSLVSMLCKQALDMHYAGLVVETHVEPEKALSDAAQQVTPQELFDIVRQLHVSEQVCLPLPSLKAWRTELDQIDENILGLLSKRAKLSVQIGRYKRRHNLSILQTSRYQSILQELCRKAEELQLNTEFITNLFSHIHEESVRIQHKTSEEE